MVIREQNVIEKFLRSELVRDRRALLEYNVTTTIIENKLCRHYIQHCLHFFCEGRLISSESLFAVLLLPRIADGKVD